MLGTDAMLLLSEAALWLPCILLPCSLLLCSLRMLLCSEKGETLGSQSVDLHAGIGSQGSDRS